MPRWSWRRSRISSPQGTRFTDGHFGAYYAAESLDTAIAETRFHRENFLRATASRRWSWRCAAISPTSPASCTTCAAGARAARRLRPGSYALSQKLGRELRDAGSNGIAFDSVRRAAANAWRVPAAAGAERAPERAPAIRLGRHSIIAQSTRCAP
jgi:hypothetical protein